MIIRGTLAGLRARRPELGKYFFFISRGCFGRTLTFGSRHGRILYHFCIGVFWRG
jgi:hypothetical protein